jgi:hypothetical protein
MHLFWTFRWCAPLSYLKHNKLRQNRPAVLLSKAFFSCRNFRACSKKKCKKRCGVYRLVLLPLGLLLQRLTKTLAMKIDFLLLIVTIFPRFFTFPYFPLINCIVKRRSCHTVHAYGRVPHSTPILAAFALAPRVPIAVPKLFLCRSVVLLENVYFRLASAACCKATPFPLMSRARTFEQTRRFEGYKK